MRRKKDIFKNSRRLKKRRLIKKCCLFIFVGVVFLSAIASFFYLPYFKIKKISVAGNSTINSENLNAEVLNYLEGKSFGIFPQSNILILSKNSLRADILDKFSRIKDVNISRSFFGTLSLNIKERNNEATFCLDNNREQCDFLDQDGITFEKAPYFSAGVFLSFFDEQGGGKLDLNQQPINQNQFKKLIDFKNLCQTESIKIINIILKKEGIYKLDTNEGWYILLNEQNDSQISFSNLKSTLDELIKDKRPTLAYIDLRFGNKVFYKFK